MARCHSQGKAAAFPLRERQPRCRPSVLALRKVRRLSSRGCSRGVSNRTSLHCQFSATARLPARQKKLPSRGGWFRPSCELKTCTPATRSAWASGHFSGQTAGRDSSARFGVKPTGNRDAGKFAPDATRLPTGCQPESLAKPARDRSHNPGRSCLRAERARRSFVWARRHRKHVGGV
jgi:hypothetical protein